jgi:hypothetical protein
MNDYDIKNGILGMGKIVSGRLSQYLNDDKRRQFYGTGQEQYENKSKDNVFYKNLRFPEIEVTSGNVIKESPNYLKAIKLYNSVEIKERLYPNSGKYILKLIPYHSDGIIIFLTEGPNYDDLGGITGLIKAF